MNNGIFIAILRSVKICLFFLLIYSLVNICYSQVLYDELLGGKNIECINDDDHKGCYFWACNQLRSLPDKKFALYMPEDPGSAKILSIDKDIPGKIEVPVSIRDADKNVLHQINLNSPFSQMGVTCGVDRRSVPKDFFGIVYTMKEYSDGELIKKMDESILQCNGSGQKLFYETLKNSIERVNQQISKADFVNIIEHKNGRWESRLISKDYVDESYKKLAESMYYKDVDGLNIPKKYFNSVDNLPAISLEVLEGLFDKIMELKLPNGEKIDYDYIKGLCENRSHYISMFLQENKIDHLKVWVTGKLGAWDDHGEFFPYRYHTAPIVRVKEKNSYKKYVIDPAMFDAPVPLGKWIDKVKQVKYQKQITTLFPALNDPWLVGHLGISFTDTSILSSDDSPTISIEEIKRRNLKAIDNLSKYQ